MADNKIQLKQIDQELTIFVNNLVNQNFTGFINAFINSGYFGTTVVYASGGNQSVFGLKTFITSPQIPYSGAADQAISMQFLLDRLSGSLNNVVYTTGNQVVSSVKYFSDLTCAFPSGSPSAVNLGYFNSQGIVFNTGDQFITGFKSFANPIAGTSAPTGSNQYVRYLELTNASGVLAAISDPSALSGFLQAQIVATGSDLRNKINLVSGQVIATGASLVNKINLLSGQIIASGLKTTLASGFAKTQLDSTGVFLQNQLNYITGIAIPIGGNSGQVLTKFSSNNYDTVWQTTSGGGGGGSESTLSTDFSNPKYLYYGFNGDTSGVFYWLGTNYGTEAWVNPYTAGRLGITAVDNGGGDDKTTIVDRTPSAYSTNPSLNNIIFDLKSGNFLIPYFYSYRYRNDTDIFSPTGWQIQGSNDLVTWDTLDNLVSGIAPSEASASKWISRPVFSSTTPYQYFQFLMSGVNNNFAGHTSIGEFELYGEFIPNTANSSLNNIALFKNNTTLKPGPILLSNSLMLDFPNTSGSASSDLILPITGATVNDTVMLGVHPNAILPNSVYTAWVSANNQATVRFVNTSGDPQNPNQGRFSITVFHDPLIPEPFSPLNLSGLKLWLKADALSLNDGDSISSWTDFSTTVNNATQGSGPSQPTFKTGIINGLPVARFDGSNDFMSFPNDPGATTTTFVVTALNATPASHADFACFIILNGTSNSMRLLAKVDATNNWGTFTSADLPAGEDLVSGQFNILELTTKSDSSVLYRNGVVKNSNTSPSAGNSSNGNIIGAENGNRFVNADIAEVLVYDNIVSGVSRFSLENYLSTKYNIH